MLIKLDNTFHKLNRSNLGWWVDFPTEGCMREDSLSGLVARLEGYYDSVSLPNNLFTTNLIALDEANALGFKYLTLHSVVLDGYNAILKPEGYWSSKAQIAPPDEDRRFFRLYSAEFVGSDQVRYKQLFTEDELDRFGL